MKEQNRILRVCEIYIEKDSIPVESDLSAVKMKLIEKIMQTDEEKYKKAYKLIREIYKILAYNEEKIVF